MAISVNPVTRVVTIPQSDLTEVVANSVYDCDTNAIRLQLRNWESSEAGRDKPVTHTHNTEYTVAGATYARKIELYNGYSIEFEDGPYSVRLIGSNNNMFDIQGGVLVRNQVQVIPSNSAGLQVVTVGSGVLPQDIIDIRDAIHLYDRNA